MPREAIVQNKIRLALGRIPGLRLFRQNVGKFWTGKKERGPGVVTLGPQDVVLRNARPVQAGLCVGSSDLIGWQRIEVTPDMVGKRIAVFVALEVKGPRTRTRKEQLNFVQQVVDAGGKAGIVRSADEAKQTLNLRK